MKRTWWKEAVVYQIYPRSFKDSNGDGIGDLQGIIDQLDYLKYLGVDVVWLSPVYESPLDDNGYDVSDYYRILKDFGTIEDWRRLADEIHARGMKIVMDMVLNHTSDEHEWFVSSRESADSPYRDFYYWRKGKDGKEPNNWESFFGGSAWVYDEKTDEYYLHLFSKKQPDLNWENPNVRRAMYDTMRFWLDQGVDGFRLDAVNLLSKRERLPDSELTVPGKNYAVCGHLNVNGPEIHDIFQEMNREVFAHYDMFTVAEMAGVNAQDGLLYTDESRKELDSLICFEHMDVDNGPEGRYETIPLDLPRLKEIMSSWQTTLQGKGWNGLYLNNHDQPRVVSRWGDDGKYRVESAKMFATILHLMQGTPYIYQGEEIGMTNIRFPSIEDYRDVEVRNYYRIEVEERGRDHASVMEDVYKKSRDNARTPMQWDVTANGGFTTGTPWIGVNPNYEEINVMQSMKDPNSILRYYRKLIQLRKRYDIIVYGDYELLLPEDPNVFAYKRTLDGLQMLVAANVSGEEQTVRLLENLVEAELLIGNYPEERRDKDVIALRPFEVKAYLLPRR